MGNTKDFQSRFERWKNGENYWDIVGKPFYKKDKEESISKEEREYLDNFVSLYECGKDRISKYTPGKDDTLIDDAYQQTINSLGLSDYENQIDLATEVVKLFDPTGISNYNDAYKATSLFFEQPSLSNAGNAALNVIGALPMIGKVTVPFKIAKLAAESGRFGRMVKRASDINKKIDTVKELVPGVKQLTSKTQDVTSKVSNKVLDVIHDKHQRIGETAEQYAKRYAKDANKVNALVNAVNFTNEGYNAYQLYEALQKDGILNWHKNLSKHNSGKNNNLNYTKYFPGKDDEDSPILDGAIIGAVPFLKISQNENDKRIKRNKLIDQNISKIEDYGFENDYNRGLYNKNSAKRFINPAWGFFNPSNHIKSIFNWNRSKNVDMDGATKDDIAFYHRHLGYKRDTTSMPITGIRFSGDYNKDGSLRLPNAEYTGLSKQAKDFIRKGIETGKIKVNKDGSWTQFEEGGRSYSKYTSHLGNYTIRENNRSGIYDIFDTYDFPTTIPLIKNRSKGKQIEIRDTIHTNKAKPDFYNPNYSTKPIKSKYKK